MTVIINDIHYKLPQSFNVTSVLKVNLSPFLQEEALNEDVMRNYTLVNFGY